MQHISKLKYNYKEKKMENKKKRKGGEKQSLVQAWLERVSVLKMSY